MKKTLILTVIAIMALGVFALANSNSVGPTCSATNLSVTGSIYVKQGFVATATSYDATFCGVTGYALAGMEVHGADGTVSGQDTGILADQLSTYGVGPYASGADITSFAALDNYDLILAGLQVQSNYSTVTVAITAKGETSGIGDLNVVLSTIDDSNYAVPPNSYGAHFGSKLTLSSQSQTGELYLSTPLGLVGSSPYEGYLFIYTVYNGTHYFDHSGSNQIAPWTEAGKYTVSFSFTITPDFSF